MADVEFSGGRLLTNVKLAFRKIGDYLYPQHIIVDSTGTEVGIGRASDSVWNGSLSDATLVSIAKATHNQVKNSIGAVLDTAGNVFYPDKLERLTVYNRGVTDQVTITHTLFGADGTWVKSIVQMYENGEIASETDSGWTKQGA